ncbi:hypothetical protein JR316_0001317 [Psilocybe cubensis]|uniref:Uncharacterized protein n=2 Tax=Psilocybe cubensis TaxID=181762 RepID=A0ACB8HHQ1_PSICU|nr:hypothetical protein JR316_0001317 [Psilocybe cubensis]KAH9487247.1 hypothetical protein JR316_0001317 [Psilocybe cubensis]
MPPRSETFPGGIVKLTNLLAHLNATPRLTLSGVKRLRLSLASQNDHFGARHFVKENLPQIRWANPALDIEVRRERKSKSEQWRAEMELEFSAHTSPSSSLICAAANWNFDQKRTDDGNVHKFDINDKRSTTILKELMNTAGGDPWKSHVVHCEKTGRPVLPEEENEEVDTKSESKPSSSKLPTLDEYLEKHPEKKAEHVRKQAAAGKKKKPAKRAKSKAPPPKPFATPLST